VEKQIDLELGQIIKDCPYGHRRLLAASKFIWYVHNEALKQYAYLARNSGLPSELWNRVERCFCNSYGLSKWKGKIYVQEEVDEGQRLGLQPMYEDYLNNVLDDDYKERPEGIRWYCEKYEKLARDIQKETGSKAPIGEEYDVIGRRKVD